MTLNEAIERLQHRIMPRIYNPTKEDREALVIAVNAIKAILRLNDTADKMENK